MPTSQNLSLWTLEADADLSAKQFYVVGLSADGQVALAADADHATLYPITTLQNDPSAAGQPASLAQPGSVAKALSGAAIAIGDRITCDGNGKAISTTTDGDAIIGTCLETVAATDTVFEYLNYPGQYNAA